MRDDNCSECQKLSGGACLEHQGIKVFDTRYTAYRVFYDPNCEPLEEIGYFYDKQQAEEAKQDFIIKRGLKENAICCKNSKYVEIQEIYIK